MIKFIRISIMLSKLTINKEKTKFMLVSSKEPAVKLSC